MQWVADNVDHNIVTLDGKGTFHGMDIIATTPSNTAEKKIVNVIKRLKERKLVALITSNKGIPITKFIGPKKPGSTLLKFKPLLHLEMPYTLPTAICTDLLWQTSWLFGTETKPPSNWSGFMQHVFSTQGNKYLKVKCYNAANHRP